MESVSEWRERERERERERSEETEGEKKESKGGSAVVEIGFSFDGGGA